jgi:hypothetical protein
MFLGLIVWLAGCSLVHAQLTETDVDEYFAFLTRVNHYSPLEHAGSHGTLGASVGVGLISVRPPNGVDTWREHWRRPGQDPRSNKVPNGRLVIPQIHVLKGLPWSLDIGGGYGRDRQSEAQSVSGYVHWAVYEAFARPAIGLRVQYSRLWGLATSDVSTVGLGAFGSYGFLRFFTLYGSYGVSRNDLQMRFGANYGTTLLLSDEAEGRQSAVFLRRARSVGLQYQLLPPFWIMAFEYSQMDRDVATYSAKISLGI